MSHNIHAISHCFKMLYDLFKLIMNRRLSNDSFEFIDQIAIKYLVLKCLVVEEFSS